MADATLTSNEHVDHKRWLAETWQMIEQCAASLNPMARVSLSPAGCKALIETRSAEYCRGRDDQMKAAADQLGNKPHESETCEQPWMVAADRLLEKIGHVPGIEHERKALLAFMPSPNAQKTFPPAGPVGNTSPVDTATGGKPAGGDALKAGAGE